jgi:hypothetical protein
VRGGGGGAEKERKNSRFISNTKIYGKIFNKFDRQQNKLPTRNFALIKIMIIVYLQTNSQKICQRSTNIFDKEDKGVRGLKEK